MIPLPNSSRAVTAEALKTMTAPTKQSARSIQTTTGRFEDSGARSEPPGGFVRLIFFSQTANELLEYASAVLVTLKLVETRAGGSQQDGVAGTCTFLGEFHGARHRARSFDGHDAAQLRFNLVRGGADQQNHARVLA